MIKWSLLLLIAIAVPVGAAPDTGLFLKCVGNYPFQDQTRYYRISRYSIQIFEDSRQIWSENICNGTMMCNFKSYRYSALQTFLGKPLDHGKGLVINRETGAVEDKLKFPPFEGVCSPGENPLSLDRNKKF